VAREHFREPGVVARVVGHAQIPERTLKRRFKQATGLALIDYVQNLRIEEAKHLLESSDQAVDEISRNRSSFVSTVRRGARGYRVVGMRSPLMRSIRVTFCFYWLICREDPYELS
jgi:transcriptional regulator GlxA family with amidase domain